MPKDVPIAEARNRLSTLVHAIEKGTSVRLTRRGKPVAMLLSLGEYEGLRQRQSDLCQAIEAFRAETDLGNLDIEEIFRDVRDASPGREVNR